MDTESPKRSATRKALVDAAFVLFAERGFEDVTIDDITLAAGVSRRTFFRYYPSKEAIVYPYSEERISLFYDLVMEETNGQPASIAQVSSIYLWLCRLWLNDTPNMNARRRLIDSSQSLVKHDLWVGQLWCDCMTRVLAGLAKDQDPQDATPRQRMVAGTLIGGLRQMFTVWRDSDGTADLVGLGTQVFELIEAGIRCSEGQQESG